MPASGGDPVTAALRLSLTASQSSQDDISIEKRLAASTARILLTRIEYEPAGNCLANTLSHLKSKYIVLKSQDSGKNGANTSSSNSLAPVNSNSQNGTMKPEPDSILPTPKVTLFPAERVQLGWRGNHCVGAGMINVGNTCYLNSTLQALFHVPAFVNWLHSDSNHVSNCTVAIRFPDGTMNGECIICAMNKTLKASQSKTGTIIKPFLIYNKLKFICKHLVHGQQEDAHEFMRYLLESMEKAYLTRYKGNKLDSYSKETTPLNQIFGGYIRTEVTCLQCNGVSTTFQHCQDLLLDIRRASTLDDALSAYFCKERLDGDDAYRCERCHKKVSATKKFSIEKPPQVLCIQFKRFSILGGKINKHVSFNQKLDLTRFLCPQSTHHGPVPLTYRLVSLVTHVGSSVHCGHYTAVAQTSTGHYYQFDDSSVRPISLSAVMDTNAYIMMYEREPVPKSPSLSQSMPAATATTATCTMNGQKSGLAARNQSVQGPVTIPVNHKIGPSFNHKPNSMNIVNQKPRSDSTSISAPFGPSALPPAKDRDRVVFGLHQPAASPAPPRLVMHIKNGKVYRPPPQPSPQQQEPSASTTASSAASLVPYCESGEDESSSSDSEPPTRLWDMPSLDDVSPSSPCSKPVPVNDNVSLKNNLKRNSEYNNSENVSSVTISSSQISSPSCSFVGKSAQTKKLDLNQSVLPSVSYSEIAKSKKNEELGSQKSIVCFPFDKHKDDKSRTRLDNYSPKKKLDSLSPDKSVLESSKPRKTDIASPSRSRNCCISPIKNSAENLDSRRTDSRVQEAEGIRNNSIIRASASKIRQYLDMASGKEIVNHSLGMNLHVNTSQSSGRVKLTSGWQVTDQLLHSPSIASESSTSTTSVANSTTDWAVSDIKQKCNRVSKSNKKQSTNKVSSSDSDNHKDMLRTSQNLPNNDVKVKDEPLWENHKDSRSKVVSVEDKKHNSNGNSLVSKYDIKSIQSKKRKHTDSSSCDEDKEPTSPQWSKNKEHRDIDIDEYSSKEYDRKREKKLKKLKKHKKRDRCSADNGEASESTKEEESFEWVEKTHETLGLNSSYPVETNGHSSWDGARKADVINHLTHLSHRGYGTTNVNSWSGERSRMDEEVERDRREDRKRCYNNAYDEEYDRGRVKKVKNHHMNHHVNNMKYNNNPFQDYHSYKQKWNNSNGNGYYNKIFYRNGNKSYYHHNNNNHSRHNFNGRSNGYHGNKYRNGYSKRDHWKH